MPLPPHRDDLPPSQDRTVDLPAWAAGVFLVGAAVCAMRLEAAAGRKAPVLPGIGASPDRVSDPDLGRSGADAGIGMSDGASFGGKTSAAEPHSLQRVRARGRNAHAPWALPWAGWNDVLWRTYVQVGDDRLLAVAAGVVFYGLLALFPAITAFVSFYGLFTSYATISDHLSTIAGLLPASAFGIVQDQVMRVIAKGDVKLGFAFLFSAGLALWSANAGMKAILDALNVVYEAEEQRGYIRLTLVALVFTVGAIVLLMLALGSVVVIPALFAGFGIESWAATAVWLVRWPMMFVVVVGALGVLYRYGPSRTQAQWQWLSTGSFVAALLWVGGSLLLSYYISNFAHYDATYGSLGAAIGLMMWMWLSSIVILLGAELNSEIEHQVARDTTVHGSNPLGTRGATMADTVGRSRTEPRITTTADAA
jgi:membrane protein